VDEPTDKPAVQPYGTGVDPRTRSWHRVYGVRDPDGRVSRVPVPFAAGEHELFQRLAAAGYRAPLLRAERTALLRTLEAQETGRRYTIATVPGWVEGTAAFATAGRVFGADPRSVLVDLGGLGANGRLQVSGTVSDWQTRVAAPALGNALAMFCIEVQFAAPLMVLTGDESGGVQAVGDSSIGKSSLLAGADSVWGLGVESWHSTRNGLDLLAASHNDMPLLLDESQLAGEVPREVAETILHAGYRLQGGRDKVRRTDQAPRWSWRLLFLGTSEKSQAEMARDAGVRLQGGQVVRNVDVRADAGRGMGVWEDLHGASSPALFSDRFRENGRRYRGAAATAYLECLVADVARDRPAVAAETRRDIGVFLREAMVSGAAGIEARVARRFGLPYAGAMRARRYGVLGWSEKDILEAALRCHARVILPAHVLRPQTAEESIGAVAGYILAERANFIDLRAHTGGLTSEEFAAAAGLVYPRGRHGVEFCFPAGVFRDRVCGGLSARLVAQHLREAGLMHQQAGGKTTVTRDFPEPLGRARVVSVREEILRQR
jgi:hypothetical protein